MISIERIHTSYIETDMFDLVVKKKSYNTFKYEDMLRTIIILGY